jgi:hypothetical protein
VLVAAGIACIMMPAAAGISHWFIRSRGTAMGIICAGSSLSAFLFYPLDGVVLKRTRRPLNDHRSGDKV